MWKRQINRSRYQSLMELTFLGTRRLEWGLNDYKLSFSMYMYVLVMFCSVSCIYIKPQLLTRFGAQLECFTTPIYIH